MQTHQQRPSPGQMYNTVVMVLGQFLISVVILAGLVWSGMIAPLTSSTSGEVVTVLFTLGIALPVIGIVLKRKLLARSVMVSGTQQDGSKPNPQMSRLFPAYVVSFACFEAGAVLGFIVYYLSASAEKAALLFAIAGACMLVHWPAKALFEEPSSGGFQRK